MDGAVPVASRAVSAAAPGFSLISGSRSSTSKTRSKLTSAVITWIWTLDRDPIGPYTRPSSWASATSVPNWNAPLTTRAAADAVHHRGEQPGQQGDGDHEDHPVHVPGDADLADLERLGGEQLGLLARAPVELGQHRARDVEPLGHRGAHLGVELHGLPRQALQAAAEQAGGEDEQRDQHQADEADQPGQVEQGDQDDDQRQDVGQDAGQHAHDRLLRADHVPVEPADQRAGLRAGEERQGLALHVVEDLGAQVVDEALADPRGEVAVYHAEQRVEHRDARDGQRHRDDDALVAGDDPVVDQLAQQQRVDHGDRRVERRREQVDRQLDAVRPGVAGDPLDRPWLELLLGDRRVHAEPAAHPHALLDRDHHLPDASSRREPLRHGFPPGEQARRARRGRVTSWWRRPGRAGPRRSR